MTSREEALERVADYEAKRAAAVATAADARAEADRLDAGAADAVLDDAAGEATDLVARITALRAQADVQDRVAVEAVRRREAARSDALRAEADELDAEVGTARRELEEHRSRVAQAKAELERLTGAPVVVLSVEAQLQRQRDANPGARGTAQATVEDRLVAVVTRLEVQQEVLRVAAEDVSAVRARFPELSYSELPASLQAGGVASLPGFYPPPPPRDWQAEFDAAVAKAREACDAVDSHLEACEAEPARMAAAFAHRGDPLPGLVRQRDEAIAAAHTVQAQAQARAVEIVGDVPVASNRQGVGAR